MRMSAHIFMYKNYKVKILFAICVYRIGTQSESESAFIVFVSVFYS